LTLTRWPVDCRANKAAGDVVFTFPSPIVDPERACGAGALLLVAEMGGAGIFKREFFCALPSAPSSGGCKPGFSRSVSFAVSSSFAVGLMILLVASSSSSSALRIAKASERLGSSGLEATREAKWPHEKTNVLSRRHLLPSLDISHAQKSS